MPTKFIKMNEMLLKDQTRLLKKKTNISKLRRLSKQEIANCLKNVVLLKIYFK